jgi:peptide/nickel transport system substrate-binding protein
LLVALTVTVVLALLTGCAQPTPLPAVATKAAPAAQPTAAPPAAPTAAPAAATKAPEPTKAAAAPAATKAPEPTKAAAKGGSLTYVLNQEIATLDPGMMRFAVEQMVGNQIFDNLVWLDADKKLQPGLAKSWKANADYTVFDFDLRTDVKFHDGQPFNADAAVAWFQRVLDPNYKIGGAVNYLGKIAKIEKTGDYGVRMTLKSPSVSFLGDMSQRYAGIGSPKAAAAAGDKFGVQPVGTGPFIFKEYLPGSHVKLVKNPDYKWGPPHLKHEGAATLDEVTFRFIPEDPSRTAALESGNANVISRTPYSEAGRLAKDAKYKVVSNFISGVPQHNALNVSVDPTNDPKVRQAINFAIDRDGIVKTVYFGLTKPAYGPVNQWDPTFDPKVKDLYKYDPEKAKQLLTEAGWVDKNNDGIREKDGKNLTVILGQNQGWNEWVEFLQANLKAVGFDAKISTLTAAANTERGNSCKEAMPSNGGVNYDPLALNGFFGSKASSNWACTKDEKLDKLIEDAGATTDMAKREQLIKDIQMHIMQNAYMVPVVELAFFTTMQKGVDGIVYDATGFYPWLLDARVQ